MRWSRAVLVSAIAATVLPAAGAYAADAAPADPPAAPPAAPQLQPQSQPQFQFQFGGGVSQAGAGLRIDGKPSGLQFEKGGAVFSGQPYEHRNNLASGAGTSLNIAPAISATRAGWAFSGRLGPMRWLTPLDGEGDTRMRFGGRLPGQPRVPGTGLFSLGVHYTFE